MRRVIILVFLLLGMRMVLALGDETEAPQSLLAFGFLILAAYSVGELAKQLGVPKIVGYLLAGLLFGPGVLGILSGEVSYELAPVADLAVALIAFLAGAELRWSEVKEQGTKILRIMVSELGIAFVGIFTLLLALRSIVPFLEGATWPQSVALSALFASIAIVHSPAVTLALLKETGANGPVARTTLGVVLVADVAVILMFSGALAWARSVTPVGGAAPAVSFGLLAWEILGSVLVGAIFGGVIALYLRFVMRELVIFGIVLAFFGAEIAHLAHVELLLMLLTAGFVTENFSQNDEGEQLRHAMERSAAPIFVVFFALAGAKIALAELVRLWYLVLPIVVVRALGIRAGSRLGARWARASGTEARYSWMGLISQAGVAIGLSAIVAEAYPERGARMRDVLLAVIAINETVGPILFRRALGQSGELAGAGAPAVIPGSAPMLKSG